MDLSGCSFMDLDQDSLSGGDGMSIDHDHVKWQGSQTANHALNQLIRSTVNDQPLSKAKENVDVNGSSSRSWQREPSFDQIPGFSLLSTKDSNAGSPSTSNFHTPQPTSRPSFPRSRPSETKVSRPTSALAGPSNAAPTPLASSSSLPSLTIPFFDKTNPSQFLDILKGVSARVDANAGVRPRNSTGGADTPLSSRLLKGKKRLRGVSLGSTSDVLAARLKRGRVEALRESGGVNPKAKDRDKGKGRVRNDGEDVRGIFGDSGSAQRIVDINGSAAASSGGGGVTSGNVMDVDDSGVGDDWRMIDKFGQRNNSNSSSTSSQTKMPPPPPPVPVVKHPSTVASRVSTNSTSSTPTSSSASTYTSTSRATSTSHSTHIKKEAMATDKKPPTTSQTPKYHPLLLQPPKKAVPVASSSSSVRHSNAPSKLSSPHLQTTSTQPNSNQNLQPKIKSEYGQVHHVPAPAPVPALPPPSKVQPPAAIPRPLPASTPSSAPLPSSTPQFPSSSQSSRPPALGMRRTHTLPTASAGFSSSSSTTTGKMVPSLQKGGVLPSKQRGFKPPLLSSSQPQAPSRSQIAHDSSAHGPSVTTTTTATEAHVHSHAHASAFTTTRKTNESASKTHTAMPVSSNGSGSTSSTSNSPQRGGYGSGGVTGPPSSSLSRSTSGSPVPSSSSASSLSVCVSRKGAGSRASLVSVQAPAMTTATSKARATATANANAKGAVNDKTKIMSGGNPTHGQPKITPQHQHQPQPVPRPDSRARVASSVPPPPHPPVHVVAVPQKAVETIPKPRPASPPLPEPADGDPDSSFGDMSFDMDALEETMRQYD